MDFMSKFVYTEVSSRPATLVERFLKMKLVFKLAADPDVTASQRWRLRFLAVKHNVFSLRSMTSTYVWSDGEGRQGVTGVDA